MPETEEQRRARLRAEHDYDKSGDIDTLAEQRTAREMEVIEGDLVDLEEVIEMENEQRAELADAELEAQDGEAAQIDHQKEVAEEIAEAAKEGKMITPEEANARVRAAKEGATRGAKAAGKAIKWGATYGTGGVLLGGKGSVYTVRKGVIPVAKYAAKKTWAATTWPFKKLGKLLDWGMNKLDATGIVAYTQDTGKDLGKETDDQKKKREELEKKRADEWKQQWEGGKPKSDKKKKKKAA